MTEDLDRMFRLLVTTLRSRSPQELTRPFEVGDLYQNILPYRLFRRELGLETNQAYELTLLALLSGAGGYLIVDDRMADTLRRELAAVEPQPGAFRQFATTQVSISPEALAGITQDHRGANGGASAAAAPGSGPAASPEPEVHPRLSGSMSAVPAPGVPMTASGRSPIVPTAGEGCRFCGGELPPGRPLTFCPHCGQDQTVLHCQACGTELEVGWKFCTTCGRGVASA